VTLAGSESGLVRAELPAEHLELPAVLMTAGVPSVVGSLWKIN
jgi:hypothetical protein